MYLYIKLFNSVRFSSVNKVNINNYYLFNILVIIIQITIMKLGFVIFVMIQFIQNQKKKYFMIVK